MDTFTYISMTHITLPLFLQTEVLFRKHYIFLYSGSNFCIILLLISYFVLATSAMNGFSIYLEIQRELINAMDAINICKALIIQNSQILLVQSHVTKRYLNKSHIKKFESNLTLILPGFQNYVKGQRGGRIAVPIVNRQKCVQTNVKPKIFLLAFSESLGKFRHCHQAGLRKKSYFWSALIFLGLVGQISPPLAGLGLHI